MSNVVGLTCGKCPFFDSCRCHDKITGATNGSCSLLGKDDVEYHDHRVNAKTPCQLSRDKREAALFDLVKKQGWTIDSLIRQLSGLCYGIDCVDKMPPDTRVHEKISKLNQFATTIKKFLEEREKNWRVE